MLIEQLTKDIIQSMKDKDKVKKGTLQLVKGNIEKVQKELQRPLTRDEEIQAVQKEVKQTKESLSDAEKYGRADLVETNKQKLEILAAYLPKQLTEQEVTDVCVNLGITSGMNMGQAMKIAMAELKGKTESALISKVVKSLIA